ncbi:MULTISPECIES: ribonuclease HII [Ruminococcus]|uniref:Ribonuclease HII n=1 Tax=Ruminococcus flavefaciens TaxID=1265 RepID=A0A315Y3N2_RUMFL|nr:MULTISPECIES: ribonuclease HII [Ruminococcus]MBR1430934.1 ribonuclease HII [Ruminococcus sp.]PWJ15230.1 RNase HII [Ruminococcus flavefaciens]SSA40276.1 RNase HII [Ruminococcus flavefaciens]
MARIILHKELFDYDSQLRKEYPVICGVDEAGRGPLAGDVYAAAVVLNDDVLINYLNDSKKISEKRRELLYDEVIEKADAYCIATASVEEIDRLNILQATMLAMKRAVAGLGVQPDIALIDGNRLPDIDCECRYVIHGDAVSASIAAASILAKVARDRYMRELDEKYPQYCFGKHKGYGTAMHYEKLAEYGISDVHRRTFLKKLYDEK